VRKIFLAIVVLLLFSAPSIVSAYSMQKADALLKGYNISSSLISSLQPVNLSYSGTQYLGLYKAGMPYFIVNLTGNYSLVLNASAIASIIKGYTITTALAQTNFATLNQQMHLYEQSSAGPIGDCLTETGLTSGATCTLANYCEACLTIPLCKCALTDSGCPPGTSAPGGGVAGPFGEGIIQFEGQYSLVNASFNAFYSATANINATNVLQNLAAAESAFANISSITRVMGDNPIFPPTANVTPNMIAGCSSYINQSTAPWYCTAIGYCESTSYNYSKLAYINLTLSDISSLPLSNAQINTLAANVSSTENSYLYPLLSKQKLAALKQILNRSVPGYGALVNGTEALLSHINNSTLQNELNALQANYSDVLANYVSMNLSKANATLGKQYAAMLAEYTKLNATYGSVLVGAKNNTAKLLELQLYGAYNAKISEIALAELSINNQLSSGKLSNVTKLGAQVKAISSQLASYTTSPISFTELARSVDGPFIRSLAASMGLGYANAISMAPTLGMLLSLIIGIVLLICVYLFQFLLKREHKLALNPRRAKNWRMVFVACGVLLLLYLATTYVLLSGANTSAPYSAFQGAYKAAQSVVVVLNGTATPGMTSCANQVGAEAQSQGKKPVMVSFSGGLCKTSNSTATADSCLNFYAQTNTPVIILTNSSHTSLRLYSLYGTVLSAGGNESVMSTCYVSLLK
jgi:hypothetical protein